MGEWTKERHEACKARHNAIGPSRVAFHMPWPEPHANAEPYSDGTEHEWSGEIASYSGSPFGHGGDGEEDPVGYRVAAIVSTAADGEFYGNAHQDIPDMLAEIERLRTMVRARGELDLDFWTDVFAETGEELDGKAVRFASKRRTKQALNLIGDAIKGARGRAKK